MKLTTTLFLSLFISTIAAKVEVPSDDTDISYSDEHLDSLENGTLDTFQYKPSRRLEEMENNLSGDRKKFIQDGNVKETLINTFLNSMKTDVAVNGLEKLKKNLKKMINGPEASWVIGTFGENLNRVYTSREGAKIINMIASTIHVLLTKLGEKNVQESDLGKLSSSLFSLCSSPKMPDIVDKTGELAVAVVNKPNAALFIRQYWYEWQKLLKRKNLDKKINDNFNTVSHLMVTLSNQKKKTTK